VALAYKARVKLFTQHRDILGKLQQCRREEEQAMAELERFYDSIKK